MTVRFTALAASALASAIYLASAPALTHAQSNNPSMIEFQVPAGLLEQALNTLSQQAGVALIFSPELTDGISSEPVQGSYTLPQALDELLQGTGIQFDQIGDTITLRRSSEQAPVVTLEPYQVLGTEPKRYDASEARSAFGIDIPIADTARSVQVIPEQIFLDQHAQDLRDVLKNVSGVQSRNISGGTTDSFVIRGFEVQNILLDGFQIDRNNQRIQTTNIDRVEVVKGANAVLTGQSQPGGTINVVTKKPQAEARRVISGTFDEFGRKELALDSTGALNDSGSLLYRVVGELEDSETFRETDEKASIQRTLFAPSVSWQISESDRITANLEYINSELPIDEGTVAVPDADGELGLAKLDHTVRLGEKEDISDSSQLTAGIHYNREFDSGWALLTSAMYQKSEVDSFSNAPIQLLTEDILVRRQQRFEPQTDRYQFLVQVNGEVETAGITHKVVAGLDYNQREFESEGSFDFTTENGISLSNPVYGQVESNLVSTTLADLKDTQTGFYVQDLVTLNDRLKISLGLRLDQFERDGSFEFNGNVNNRKLDKKSELSPNLGAIVNITDLLSFYTSYSESYDPNNPSTNVITGETITVDPSEGEQYEVGLRASTLDDKMTVNLAYYDLTRSNIPFGRDPETNVSLLNGEEHSQGMELDANVQFANGLSLIANYAYTDAEISKGNRKGNTPRNVPENSANLWLTYEFTEGKYRGLGLGGGFNYKGKRYVDADNSFELDAYTSMDATVFYYHPLARDSQLRFQLSVKNLTDEKVYHPNSNILGIGVGEPRTISASIGYEF